MGNTNHEKGMLWTIELMKTSLNEQLDNTAFQSIPFCQLTYRRCINNSILPF